MSKEHGPTPEEELAKDIDLFNDPEWYKEMHAEPEAQQLLHAVHILDILQNHAEKTGNREAYDKLEQVLRYLDDQIKPYFEEEKG